MPDVNNMFPSNWMKVGDLQGGVIDVVVSHVIQEEIKQGEMVWVIHFHPNPQLPRAQNGNQVGAVLKTQNADAVATIYGPMTEMWAGKSIQLYIKNTNMGPGIGMRPVAAAFQQAMQAPVAPAQPVAPQPQASMGPGDQAAALAAQAPLPPAQPATQPVQPAPAAGVDASDPIPF